MTAKPAEEYRGARRNAGRSTRAKDLKAQRIALGMTRSDFDRERYLDLQADNKLLQRPAARLSRTRKPKRSIAFRRPYANWRVTSNNISRLKHH